MQNGNHPMPTQSNWRQKLAWLMIIVAIVMIVSSFSYFAFSMFSPSDKSVAKSQVTQVPPTATPTPTPLKSADFDTFLPAFAQSLKEQDYKTVQDSVNKKNFKNIYLSTDIGIGTWDGTYQELETGDAKYEITMPKKTPEEAGFACIDYNEKGIGSLSMNFPAKELRYVVGTRIQPGPIDESYLPTKPGATVFIFGLTEETSQWLWTGVVHNNVCF